MSAPVYMASGGVVFISERQPITLERAEAIRAVHLHNVSHWLETASLSPTARLGLAKIEQGLADEMAAAIGLASSLALGEGREADPQIQSERTAA